jgi:hypothetical protein
MNEHDALRHFRGEEKYNCAQAILKAYAPVTGVRDSCLAEFKRSGGGRSPTGECGALYAAKQMLPDPAAQRKLAERFVQAAGSTQCREIRSARQFSCQQCVEAVADELLEHVAEGGELNPPAGCAVTG